MEGSSPQERFEDLIRKDTRYHPEVYKFVYDALDFTVRHKYGTAGAPEEDLPAGCGQHVTGQDLLEGLREYALEEFGCLAGVVFDSWGVHRSEDFGEIVFNMVETEILGKTEEDSREDFARGYDFRETFGNVLHLDEDFSL